MDEKDIKEFERLRDLALTKRIEEAPKSIRAVVADMDASVGAAAIMLYRKRNTKSFC